MGVRVGLGLGLGLRVGLGLGLGWVRVRVRVLLEGLQVVEVPLPEEACPRRGSNV